MRAYGASATHRTKAAYRLARILEKLFVSGYELPAGPECQGQEQAVIKGRPNLLGQCAGEIDYHPRFMELDGGGFHRHQHHSWLVERGLQLCVPAANSLQDDAGRLGDTVLGCVSVEALTHMWWRENRISSSAIFTR